MLTHKFLEKTIFCTTSVTKQVGDPQYAFLIALFVHFLQQNNMSSLHEKKKIKNITM
jgi:hypothetical protein